MSKFCVILPAAGQSRRFHDLTFKKPYVCLENQAVWLHSAQLFLNREDVGQLIVVISPEDEEFFWGKYRAEVNVLGITVVLGGAERADSIENAISKISDECDFVCVHDAARPCLTQQHVNELFNAAERTGAVVSAVPVSDTLKEVRPIAGRSQKSSSRFSLDSLIPDEEDTVPPVDGQILRTVSRQGLWSVQTPQVFRKDWFIKTYQNRDHQKSRETTDDAMLFEQMGYNVMIVEGSRLNIKITTKSDLQLANAILKILPKPQNTRFHPFAD